MMNTRMSFIIDNQCKCGEVGKAQGVVCANGRYNILNVCLLLCLLALFHLIPSDYSRTNLLFCLLVCVVQLLVVICSIKRYAIRPSFVFLLSFFVVNCQCYFDLLLGIIQPTAMVFVNPNLINKGVILSAIAFTSFSVGYHSTNKFIPCKRRRPYNKALQKVFTCMQLCSFFIWFITLTPDDFSGESYLTSGEAGQGSDYVGMLFTMTQIVALAYFSLGIRRTLSIKEFFFTIPRWVLISSMIYVVVKLMSGDRGGAIFTILLYMFVFIFTTKYRFNLLMILPILVLGALIMTSISAARSFGNQLSFVEKVTYIREHPELLDSYESISPPTRELAGSVICTHVALDEIYNKNKPFHYGEFHFCYMMNCLPFVSNYILSGLGVEGINRVSSEYITVTYSGKNYTSGMGTSTLADNFLELGAVGVVLALFIIGWLFKKVDIAILSSHGAMMSFGMVALIFTLGYAALAIPRSYVFYYVRIYVYILLLYQLTKMMFYSISKNTKVL